MKKIVLLLLSFLFVQQIFSQTIKGRVTDEKNNVLRFVNIGIPMKNIGTVSDVNGMFDLKIGKSNISDTLHFSFLGFEIKKIPIINFLKQQKTIIKLKSTAYYLPEIEIKSNRYKYKILGNTFNNKNNLAGYKYNKLGFEMGVVMRNRRKGKIQSVSFNIGKLIYDTLFLRLNIYKYKNKKILNNILKKPYYITISKKKYTKTDGKIKLDLRNLNLMVKGFYFVSLEIIIDYNDNYEDDFYDGGFLLCNGLLSFSKTYTRETSFGKWQKAPFNIAINSMIKYEK